MTHHIQKQQLLLTIGNAMDAFRIQHAAGTYFQESLLSALEAIFDELSPEDEVIQVDRLLVDLGAIHEMDLQGGGLSRQLYERLREAVRKVISGAAPGGVVSVDSAPALRRVSLRESVLEQWWFYMEHGYLPWNAGGITDGWYEQVLETFSVDYSAVSRLRKVFADNPVIARRISMQHDDGFLETLVTVMVSSKVHRLGEEVEQAARVLGYYANMYTKFGSGMAGDRERIDAASGEDELKGAGAGSGVADRGGGARDLSSETRELLGMLVWERKPYLWRLILTEAARRPEAFRRGTAEEILLRLIEGGMVAMELVLEREASVGEPTPLLQLFRKRYIERLAEKGRRAPDDKMATGERQGTGSGDKGGEGEPEERKASGRKPQSSREKEEGPGAEEADDVSEQEVTAMVTTVALSAGADPGFEAEEVGEEGIYLPNAGVVLVHPFLATFFHRLGFWDGGGFTGLAERQRAVFLVHYLATGEKSGPEYALVFPKMLCGYALEMPLPQDIVITPDEEEEANVLLENVLARWEKLQGTSVTGLREGFLSRSGKLFNRGGRLCLMMETSGIDVLLDYLPWNLSLVKMPWLRDILYVEWR